MSVADICAASYLAEPQHGQITFEAAEDVVWT